MDANAWWGSPTTSTLAKSVTYHGNITSQFLIPSNVQHTAAIALFHCSGPCISHVFFNSIITSNGLRFIVARRRSSKRSPLDNMRPYCLRRKTTQTRLELDNIEGGLIWYNESKSKNLMETGMHSCTACPVERQRRKNRWNMPVHPARC